MTTLRRLILTLLLACAAFGAGTIAPAWACGCGAYSPEDGGTASVSGETGLVVWDGSGVEDLYLSLHVRSDVESGAVLIPVPDRGTEVSLGPAELFADLHAVTQFRRPASGDGAAGGAPESAVTVERRQRLGQLDVATLSATDPSALTAWLRTNGFAAKPALAAGAKPYLDEGWSFVAVRLAPGERIDGDLQPLKLRFRTPAPVYPIRLSAMAPSAQRVRLYVLSAGELTFENRPARLRTVYSRAVPSLDGREDLASVAASATHLARYEGTLTPASDFAEDFRFAATHAARADVRRSVDPAVLLVLGLGGVAAAAAAGLWLANRS